MITKFRNLRLIVIEMIEALTGFYEIKDIHLYSVSVYTYQWQAYWKGFLYMVIWLLYYSTDLLSCQADNGSSSKYNWKIDKNIK